MDSITLDYELADLPTAQHKAGLAGLILQIRDLEEGVKRRESEYASLELDDVPTLNEVSASRASITLTARSCQALMDACYAAVIGRAEVEKPWAGVEILETREELKTDPKTKKTKVRTIYVHPVLQPNNRFVARNLSEEIWIKLWRDMLFAIPRSKPTTRNPYKQTAAKTPCAEGEKIWKELQQFAKERARGRVRTTSLASSLLLSAQDATAENVSFSERSDYVLALHFWPLACLTFVPWLLDIDPAQPDKSRSGPVGYAIAVPDVANLKRFCGAFPKVLSDLNGDANKQGYRPKAACLDVAAQAALDTLTQAAWLVDSETSARADKGRLVRTFNAVEYWHLNKMGNNVKLLASGRVAPDPNLLAKYERIRSLYRNPLFRQHRVAALLSRSTATWWETFERPVSTFPAELFVNCARTPAEMRSFPFDLRTAFAQEPAAQSAIPSENWSMDDSASERPGGREAPSTLERTILDLVRRYVRERAEKRSGRTVDEFKNKKTVGEDGKERIDVPKEYADAQAKIALQLFLEIRSRHDADFAQYFAEHFGAVGQGSLRNVDRFQSVCEALIKRPDQVRIVTLLALSAAS